MTRKPLESGGVSPFCLESRINDLFTEYVDILHSWNQRVRLTGYREPVEIRHHLVDEALLAATYFDFSSSKSSIVDFGSGNGAPGVIFAILNPSLPVRLVERKQKKLSFLSYVVSRLSLDNVTLYDNLLTALSPQRQLVSQEIWMKAISMHSLLDALSSSKNRSDVYRIRKFGELDLVPGCQPIQKHVINSEVCSLYPVFTITVSEGILTV